MWIYFMKCYNFCHSQEATHFFLVHLFHFHSLGGTLWGTPFCIRGGCAFEKEKGGVRFCSVLKASQEFCLALENTSGVQRKIKACSILVKSLLPTYSLSLLSLYWCYRLNAFLSPNFNLKLRAMHCFTYKTGNTLKVIHMVLAPSKKFKHCLKKNSDIFCLRHVSPGYTKCAYKIRGIKRSKHHVVSKRAEQHAAVYKTPLIVWLCQKC